MIRAFYNDTDRYCCDWLSNLMDAGEITPGVVDDRPIQELTPDDVKGYDRTHFFAGVGGWDIALNLARWPDARPVWTGSCPCQPFSAAGPGKAGDDERHLWPCWSSLIAECRPGTIFGEQVEAAIGWGWLDLVFTDLEAQGYACGAAILPACGVGAPHIRNRLWFVADASRERQSERLDGGVEQDRGGRAHGHLDGEQPFGINGGARGVADAVRPGRAEGRAGAGDGSATGSGIAGRLGDADSAGLQGRRVDTGEYTSERAPRAASASFWSNAEWLPCSDGKARPVEPGSFPLAHGVLRRPSKLRAYGNAIVPQVAAEVIGAFMDINQ